MRILHTESSQGWGGQEIRILREAEGMRSRGHHVWIANCGKLGDKAAAKGFSVLPLNFSRNAVFSTFIALIRHLSSLNIDIVNTHSSLDAWIGGTAARVMRKKIVRTRHLSTPIHTRFLYRRLADYVVTTSEAAVSGIPHPQCRSIPTGIAPEEMVASREEVSTFRKKWRAGPQDLLVGTACVVRSWKGIGDFLKAAHLLRNQRHIKWVVIGGGYLEAYLPLVKELELEEQVIFTGHLDSPYAAIASLDVFLLLSTANEGVSQASLQAAFLERPLITTSIGGLPEICIPKETGILVSPFSPQQVAQAVLEMGEAPLRREQFGKRARQIVEEKFLFHRTLDEMEKVYQFLFF